jgi:hypothetical protein
MWLLEFFDFSHLLSAVGLAVAGWQILRNRKLKMARKTDAFELYVKSSFILINAHRCINLLQKEENYDELKTEIGKIEGAMQSLVQSSVKQIYLSHDYSEKQLLYWVKMGKTGERQLNTFMQYIDA